MTYFPRLIQRKTPSNNKDVKGSSSGLGWLSLLVFLVCFAVSATDEPSDSSVKADQQSTTEWALPHEDFRPAILLAPGPWFDLGINESLLMDGQFLFEQRTGIHVTVVQPVRGQTTQELVEQLIHLGMKPIVIAGAKEASLNVDFFSRHDDIQFIGIGTHWSTQGAPNVQQWGRSQDLGPLLYAHSLRLSAQQTEVTHWYVNEALASVMPMKLSIDCAFGLANAEAEPGIQLQWRSLEKQKRLNLSPGVMDAQMVGADGAAVMTLYFRSGFIAFHALSLAYEGHWQAGQVVLHPWVGTWLALNDVHQVVSPRLGHSQNANECFSADL